MTEKKRRFFAALCYDLMPFSYQVYASITHKAKSKENTAEHMAFVVARHPAKGSPGNSETLAQRHGKSTRESTSAGGRGIEW